MNILEIAKYVLTVLVGIPFVVFAYYLFSKLVEALYKEKDKQ